MPREVVFVQVGQCGNQIGCRFWDQALHEHARHTGGARTYDFSMSSFFRNHASYDPGARSMAVGAPISALKARAVLVDMEEGVVNRVMRSHLGSIFDDAQYVTAVSGCGNNWAHGHIECGPEYRETILDKVRRQAEGCESLQSFFFLHSLGGGTGSGLGTYILSQLADAYPRAYRFCTSVFPSENDDVITSPYNAFFALNELKKHADCVFPMENEALQRLSLRQLHQQNGGTGSPSTSPRGGGGGGGPAVSASKLRALAQPRRPRVARGRGGAVGAAILGTGSGTLGGGAGGGRGPGGHGSGTLGGGAGGGRGPGGHGRGGGGGGGSATAAAAAVAAASRQGEQPAPGKEEAFAHMNAMAAQLLLDLTCSMRFKGSLNIDLNEITTNLVPFPGGLHFLNASFAPLVALPEPPQPGNKQKHGGASAGELKFVTSLADQQATRGAARQQRLQSLFAELFSARNQLTAVDARRSQHLAVALMARGDLKLSEIHRNVERLHAQIPMAPWNTEGFKIGICHTPPLHAPHSVLGLSNNCGVRRTFANMQRRFQRLYRVRAHLHHYTEYMEQAQVQEAVDNIEQLVRDYDALAQASASGHGTHPYDVLGGRGPGGARAQGQGALVQPPSALVLDDDLDLAPLR